jgi:osmoprotectant transport system ATP-binding protein
MGPPEPGGTFVAEPMISFRDVSKRYGDAAEPAVRDLSLDVAEGETVVFVGPSGCGKTTLLRMVNRLIEPTSGTIVVNGEDVRQQDPVQLRRGIGYVIQTVGLMPHRTVRQNMTTVPWLLGWEQGRVDRRVDELVDLFEIAPDLLPRYPSELSGGQRQRVGAARALAADPPVMLMDEPFAAVDPVVRHRLQDQFLGIQERLRKTIVFVTHDIDEAVKMADRIAILNVGGVLEQYAAPADILRAPANDFVTGFVGGERGIRRLGLIRVRDVEIDAATDADGRPTVSEDQTLRQALDVMVTTGVNAVSVIDGDGSARGVLTMDRISRELRS